MIYVDVDLTLVDELQRLKPNAWEGLLTLREAGCKLALWSTNGADYCRQIAERHEITPLFEVFLQKPDLYIDDMPSTFLNSQVLNIDAAGGDWQKLADYVVGNLVAPQKPPAPSDNE